MTDFASLDELLDPLGRCFHGEAARFLEEFRISPKVQQRIDYLARQANEGLLSDEERSEYVTLTNVADFIAILKLKSREHRSDA